MLSDILAFIFQQLSFFFINFVNIVTTPIMKLIEHYIPNLDNIFFYAYEVFTQYILVGTQFVKMVFVNFLGINHNVFSFVALCFFIRVAIFFGLRGIKLALNLWSLYKMGTTKGVV